MIFGATVLAAATALPEISSGIAAVRLGDNALAMGDILGGNAFQVCLFLVADLVAGQPVLQSAGNQNAWLAALGVALTAIYGFGVISRPTRCRARLGPDSLLALVVFAVGIAGLFFVPRDQPRTQRAPMSTAPMTGCSTWQPIRAEKNSGVTGVPWTAIGATFALERAATDAIGGGPRRAAQPIAACSFRR